MAPVLVAPDSFKGTLRASEVAAAIGRGLERAGLEPPDLCPVADGGEGTIEALLPRLGGATAGARVAGPDGRPKQASYALLGDGELALVEVAQASGHAAGIDPEAATSLGTGQLIAAAIEAGAETVLVAAGGSATTDGGAGALEVIPAQARLIVLCDVRTPWEQAARRFGPQKGADPAAVRRLEQRLQKLARGMARDPRGVPMSGAAGGLAGGLWAERDAALVAGAPFVLEALDFDTRMRAAHAVICGEGRIDESSLEGKVCGEIAVRARQAGVPAYAIAGQRRLSLFDQRILDLQQIEEAGSLAAIEQAAGRLADALSSAPWPTPSPSPRAHGG